MKRIWSVCLLLALCLSLCACDLTLDVQEGGASSGRANFWKKPEDTVETNNSQSAQTVQQENQTQQTATQPNQQIVQQPNTYVPAVTVPQAETYPTVPVISGMPDAEMYYEGSSNLEYWINYCDTLYLNDTYLYGMSEAECRIARNAIYAKSGRIFTSSDLSNYFSYYSWYSPRIHPNNFSNNMLNDAQLHNLNVIIAYEERFG